jgi:hypothetical protein
MVLPLRPKTQAPDPTIARMEIDDNKENPEEKEEDRKEENPETVGYVSAYNGRPLFIKGAVDRFDVSKVVKALSGVWKGASIHISTNTQTRWDNLKLYLIPIPQDIDKFGDGKFKIKGKGLSQWAQKTIPFVIDGTIDVLNRTCFLSKRHCEVGEKAKIYNQHKVEYALTLELLSDGYPYKFRLLTSQEAKVQLILECESMVRPPIPVDKDGNYLEPNMTGAKDNDLCTICMTKIMTIVFEPCMHMTTCSECANQCLICPICRAKVTGVRVVYKSSLT